MKVETTINGDVRVALIPDDSRDKAIIRLAFGEGAALTVSLDLREDGALVFTLKPKREEG